MEKALFKDAYGVFYRTLVFWLTNLCRQDNRLVMFRPFSIILIQLRCDPILVCYDRLLAVISDYKRGNSAKVVQGMVIYIDPLGFLCRKHSLRIYVLRIRQNGNKHHNGIDFAG